MTTSKKITVLYFGIFDPNFSRNKIYTDGLRQNGVEVLVCTDHSKGLLKYWRLFQKHRLLRNKYDAMIVGFPGYIVVPFARLIATAPVYFDALCSFYETQIISRDAYKGNPFRLPYVKTIDWLSTRTANKVLVETIEQKNYFVKNLGVREDKVFVTYTGVDESVFYLDDSIKKSERFTVLFRGRITREAGAETVVRAAKLLENENIDFLIIGFGWDDVIKDFNKVMEELKPKNVKHVTGQIEIGKLRELMLKTHVSLGQFGDNERLKRTVPHKAYESLALKIPYITARTGGISEILTDTINCLMSNVADGHDLADKVRRLKNEPALCMQLAENGYRLYEDKFTPKKVVEPIINSIQNSIHETKS
jgi:glycosyltransferase involved in cell wall biosynthesis